jgi:hypothetical protein
MRNWLRIFGGVLFKGIAEDRIDQAIDEIIEKLQSELYDRE